MISDRYARLFEPVKIGPVTAPNRFYAVPHATGHGWAQPRGAIALRAMKAEGGWGTVAVQMTEIAPNSDMANHPMERLWDDGDIPRHALGVEAIKEHGSLAAIELAHGGMRARNITTGQTILGPSGGRILRPEVPVQARAMDKSDIRTFREVHKEAVKRAIKAGYDIVYVYAAHDLSILSHFLSRRTNHRSDEYGGCFENRLRLLKQVLEDTLEAVDGKQAVALRFAVDEPGQPVGLRYDGEGRDVVEALAELPDLWDVNIAGWPEDSATARFAEEGFQLPFTDFVKSVTSKPVVGVGRFTSPDMMLSLVNQGRLDLIGAARPSIADPFLPAKIREGRVEDIRECIGCNICVSMDGYGLPVRCTQNPTISEESRRGWHPEKPALSKGRKSFLIVGAGPAGLEAARVLVDAGQEVTIADKEPVAGGRVAREARLPGFGSWQRVVDYRLGQIQSKANCQIYLSSPMTATDLQAFEADQLVFATGAQWCENLAGIDALTPDDVMDGKRPTSDDRPIVVYDDDHFYMASAMAELLLKEGYRVRYCTPMPNIAYWTDYTLEQGKIIDRLVALGGELSPNIVLTDAGDFSSTLTGKSVDIEYNSLVYVGARRPMMELDPTQLDRPTALVGDCLSPGIIQAAILSGHTVARRLLGDKSADEFTREHLIA